MSSDPQMPVANMPEGLKELETEEGVIQLRSRGTPKADTSMLANELRPSERKADTSKAAIDSCIRTGEVMKALFPDGLHLKDDEEFAIFRLFDRLVGDVAHFARTGMTQPASLRDISLHAMLLENVISSRDTRKPPQSVEAED